MARLWRKNPEFKGGKSLVKRRDGTVPDWPWFVLGAKDPCSSAALRAYADAAEHRGFDPEYVADIRAMADEWNEYLMIHGVGDPDAPRHRVDDPETVAQMEGKLGS